VTLYAYRGVDRSGVVRTGATSEEPAVLAERLHRRRWSTLTITTSDGARDVGGITRTTDTGRRIWWGEQHLLEAGSAGGGPALEPDPELRRGMAVRDDYVLVGDKTEMTAGLGNMDTQPVAARGSA
jgi:hypothetical protein